MSMIRYFIMIVGWCMITSYPAQAKPFASDLFCKTYPDSPSCAGSAISCAYCHQGIPPALNAFGSSFKASLESRGVAYPSSTESMQAAIKDIGEQDSDGDGFENIVEVNAGTLPADDLSQPTFNECKSQESTSLTNEDWALCEYDHDYTYKKMWLDFCGEPPSWDEYQAFIKLPESQKPAALDDLLDECVDSNHWIGKDGMVWEIGHYKIRPLGSVKLGEDPGTLQIVDYYADFNLFVYTQTDGNDARDILLADYTVARSDGPNTTRYILRDPSRLADGQVMQPEKRVGLLTTFWNLGFYLNYTAVARVLVAQAFLAYTGIDLSAMQGISPPPVEESLFKDYDSKGVERPECAACHTSIDPLAYPFRNYNGLTGTSQVLAGQNANGLQSVDSLGDETNLTPLSYSLPRMDNLNEIYPGINEMPEAGYIFGQRVENLLEWADVLVNSDQFAANTVKDYWRLLVGHDPRPEEAKEFQKLWQDFKDVHDFDVEAMLHDLIKTEAYGAP